MSDGIAKGVGEQLGELGKQIVTEVTQVPAKITGMDQGGTNETVGQGPGGAQTGQAAKQQAHNEQEKIAEVTRKEEAEKQQKISEARKLIQQFTKPREPEPSIREKLELEELEKKKQEIEEEKEKVKKILKPTPSRQPRGGLFGIKAKQFGGEVGKNVKSQ